MPGQLQLPSYQVPRNAMLDFSPINEAIDSNRQNALAQRKMGLMEKADARETEAFGMQKQKFASEQDKADALKWAGRAQAVDAMPPGPQRTAAYEALLASDPKFGQLDPAFRDPIQGPKLLMGKVREYISPEDAAQNKAKLGLMGAQTGLANAQAKVAGQKSVLDEAIAGMIRGDGQPQQQPQPPQGGVQPQSFEGGPPRNAMLQPVADTGAAPGRSFADPNLIQAQTAQPGAQPQQQPARPDMVQTQLGPMTKEEARRKAFGLSMAGKGDAGKMLLDQSTPDKLGKEGGNANDKRELNTTELLGRLGSIKKTFDPNFLTMEEQAKQYGVSWLDSSSYLRGNIPEETRANFKKYTTFKQNTLTNLNQYIQEITGAAMGVEEAKRIIAAMPNMNDSPDQFKAKMENVTQQSQLAVIRYRYLRTNGFTGDANAAAKTMSLDQMEGTMDKRANGLIDQLQKANPQATQKQIKGAVKEIMRQEFGIDA